MGLVFFRDWVRRSYLLWEGDVFAGKTRSPLKTSWNGEMSDDDSVSAETLNTNWISGIRSVHVGLDLCADLILNSHISVLCCTSHDPFPCGWTGVMWIWWCSYTTPMNSLSLSDKINSDTPWTTNHLWQSVNMTSVTQRNELHPSRAWVDDCECTSVVGRK